MTTWTDDELGALLAETFRAHEALDDEVDGRAIAQTTLATLRQRLWPIVVAAAAVIAVIAGVATYAAQHPSSNNVSTAVGAGSPAPSVAGPARAGTNAASARAESDRILRTLDLPPGTTRVAASPLKDLRTSTESFGGTRPVVPARWYIAPSSVARTRVWLLGHRQGALTLTTAGGDGGTLVWEGADAAAYTAPVLIVRVQSLHPGRTAIRASVVLGPRFDRTPATMAPSGVRSIEISKAPFDGPSAGKTTERATVTDAGTIAALVAAYDALPGGVDTPAPCGSPVDLVYGYSLTFRSAEHTLALDRGSPLCARGRSLTLDGRKLRQEVDNSDAFDALLDRALSGTLPAPAPTATSTPAADTDAAHPSRPSPGS